MRKRNGKVVASMAAATEPTSTLLTQELPDDAVGGTQIPEPRPESEVLERPTRRHYSARYKLRVLEQTDDLADGQIGAFLRREGLYWSILSTWRRQRDEGTLAGLAPRRRGRKSPPAAAPDSRRVSELEKENCKLKEQLRRVSLVLEVQKKVLSICGLPVADEKTSSRS